MHPGMFVTIGETLIFKGMFAVLFLIISYLIWYLELQSFKADKTAYHTNRNMTQVLNTIKDSIIVVREAVQTKGKKMADSSRQDIDEMISQRE